VWHLDDTVSAGQSGSVRLAVIRWCARGLTRVIANSEASARAFRELMTFDAARTEIVCDGIANEPFDALCCVPPRVLRARLHLPQDVVLVGSFSPLARGKGQHVLLEAMVLNPQMHAVLAGGTLFGERVYEAELHELAARHNLAGRVHFLGLQRNIAACMRA